MNYNRNQDWNDVVVQPLQLCKAQEVIEERKVFLNDRDWVIEQCSVELVYLIEIKIISVFLDIVDTINDVNCLQTSFAFLDCFQCVFCIPHEVKWRWEMGIVIYVSMLSLELWEGSAPRKLGR